MTADSPRGVLAGGEFPGVDFLNATDWYDSDQAAFARAVALGVTSEDTFRENKWVFRTDNPLGNGLHQALLVLTAGGLIEYDEEEDRFRRRFGHGRSAVRTRGCTCVIGTTMLHTRPRRITRMRCEISRARLRSWVTKMKLRSASSRSDSSVSTTWA